MSETVTMTLTDFLLARITEDEAVATRRVLRNPLTCPVCGATVEEFITPFGGRTQFRHERCEPCGHKLSPEQADECFVSWTPPRVQAECEAKRRIVEELRSITIGKWKAGELWADRMLGILALPYADHPDYREEWRP